jgi:uncharacterized surface protein with fasciclin (FAS1) repeats
MTLPTLCCDLAGLWSLSRDLHAFVTNTAYRSPLRFITRSFTTGEISMTCTRRTWALAVSVAALSSLVGCATTAPPANIVDVAARTPSLSTLSKLINDAGLADTLRGAGPFTVFAPSNEAFKAVPVKTLAELAADKQLLASVLTYHALPGRLLAADVKTGNAKSVNGANLALSRAGTFVTVEDAVVQQADVSAANGVVHIIDRVLMPPKR